MWPYPTVWPDKLHHQARACPCRVPSQPTVLPAPIRVSAQNCKKYISLVISAIKTRVMMNFNLLIVRDPVIFSNLAGADEGGLEAGSDLSHPGLYSTVLFVSNPRVGFQFLPGRVVFQYLTIISSTDPAGQWILKFGLMGSTAARIK